MPSEPVSIGSPVRPEGALAFGTIGSLATRDGTHYLVTCDHVIRRLGTPEGGPLKLYPRFEGTPTPPIAEFRGLTLTSADSPVADLAAAALLVPIPEVPSRLPGPSPGEVGGRVEGVAAVEEGTPVRIWGARSGVYHSGRVFSERTRERLPHPRYGSLRFDLQFAVRIDPSFLPEVGDSGGPILTDDDRLVGFLSGGPLSCTVTGTGDCIAYGVPAREALDRLGLWAIVREMEEKDDRS